MFVDQPRAENQDVVMHFAMKIFEYRDYLNYSIRAQRPMTFGALEQDQGFVLYETTVQVITLYKFYGTRNNNLTKL